MRDTSKVSSLHWVLLISGGTFLLVCAVVGLLIWHGRRMDKAEKDLQAMALDDKDAHATLYAEAKKSSGRLQFLVAKDIAEELEFQKRDAETRAKGDDDGK